MSKRGGEGLDSKRLACRFEVANHELVAILAVGGSRSVVGHSSPQSALSWACHDRWLGTRLVVGLGVVSTVVGLSHIGEEDRGGRGGVGRAVDVWSKGGGSDGQSWGRWNWKWIFFFFCFAMFGKRESGAFISISTNSKPIEG